MSTKGITDCFAKIILSIDKSSSGKFIKIAPLLSVELQQNMKHQKRHTKEVESNKKKKY